MKGTTELISNGSGSGVTNGTGNGAKRDGWEGF